MAEAFSRISATAEEFGRAAARHAAAASARRGRVKSPRQTPCSSAKAHGRVG